MNLTQRLNAATTKLALWTTNNPSTIRLAATILPVFVAVAAVTILNLPTPPTGSGGGGVGGS